jgi:hypothetical protein
MLQTTDHVELEQAGNKHDSTERKDGENGAWYGPMSAYWQSGR